MINLLPPDIKKSIRYARLNVIMIQYCILVLCVCGLVLLILFSGRALIQKTQAQMTASYEVDSAKARELAAENKKAKELSKNIDTIGSLLKHEIKFTDLLKEIGGLMPDGAVLSTLTLSSQTTQEPLILEVAAVNEQTIAVLRENLADSELFTGADIQSIARDENDEHYTFTARIQAFFPTPPSTTTPTTDTGTTKTGGAKP